MEWMILSIVPEGLIKLVPSIALIIAGWVVEKHYIGRVAFFSNACAINLALYWITDFPDFWMILFSMYANLGLVVGVYGLVKYRKKESCERWYYCIAWGYSSIIVGLMTLAFAAFLFIQ